MKTQLDTYEQLLDVLYAAEEGARALKRFRKTGDKKHLETYHEQWERWCIARGYTDNEASTAMLAVTEWERDLENANQSR